MGHDAEIFKNHPAELPQKKYRAVIGNAGSSKDTLIAYIEMDQRFGMFRRVQVDVDYEMRERVRGAHAVISTDGLLDEDDRLIASVEVFIDGKWQDISFHAPIV